MWATDTNLLVRYYTQDDPAQARRALAWLENNAPCFVPLSVVQELYWVLENCYEMAASNVLSVVDHLCSSPAFVVESGAMVRRAIQVARQGVEFSDALHWALSGACEGLATFDDRRFARKAKKLALQPIVVVL